MSKVAILVDSGTQIENDNGKSDIFVVPLTITIENTSCLDQIEITNDKVFDFLETGAVVKTSQPPIGKIQEMVQNIKKLGYEHILAISLATGLSNTLNGMVLACNSEQMPVTYVDSKSTAANQAYLAILANRLLNEGKELSEIVPILNKLADESETLILVTDLQNLSRSGRITPAVAKLANLLKIIPVMRLNHELGGKIDNFSKVRTLKKANYKIMDFFINEKHLNGDDFQITIAHVKSLDVANEMKLELENRLNKPGCVNVISLPSVVGAHMGLGGIGYQIIPLYK